MQRTVCEAKKPKQIEGNATETQHVPDAEVDSEILSRCLRSRSARS